MTAPFEFRKVPLTAILATLCFTSAAATQSLSGHYVDPAEDWTTLTLTPSAANTGHHAMVVGFLSVRTDANNHWSMFAKGVLPAITEFSQSNDQGAWAAAIGGVTVTSSQPGIHQIPPSVISAAVTEVNFSSATVLHTYAKDFQEEIEWLHTGWSSTTGSSLKWGELGLPGGSTKQFSTEQLVREFVVRQANTLSNMELTRESSEVNTVIEMVRKGLAIFDLHIAVIELQDPPPSAPGSPRIKISSTTRVEIQLAPEGNIWDFFFRYIGLLGVPHTYPCWEGQVCTIEMGETPVALPGQPEPQIVVALQVAGGGFISVIPTWSPTAALGLDFVVPVGMGVISGEAGVLDLATNQLLPLPISGGVGNSFYLYKVNIPVGW